MGKPSRSRPVSYRSGKGNYYQSLLQNISEIYRPPCGDVILPLRTEQLGLLATMLMYDSIYADYFTPK
jgi:hypothetical protein